MIKFLINIIEIAIIVKIIYSIAKFLLVKKSYGKNKKGKSILGKIGLLISNRIHESLDQRIKVQKAKRITDEQQSSKNVVEFKKYKRIKA